MAVDRDARRSDIDRISKLLALESCSACLLGAAGEILFVNAAWDRFARENGGAPACLGEALVGKTYFNYIEGVRLRAHFEGAWLRVLAGLPVTLEGDGSSAGTVRRLISRFCPVLLGSEAGATVVHEVVEREPRIGGAPPHGPPGTG